jgi:hypothetical protein
VALRIKGKGSVFQDEPVTGTLSAALRAEQHHLRAASFAHCQNFSAAGLRRLFGAAMPTELGFGSGMRCKDFTRFPKL